MANLSKEELEKSPSDVRQELRKMVFITGI